METTSVGKEYAFRNPIRCLIWSDGTEGIIPAGEIVVVKGYGRDRNFLVADWQGAEVCLFYNEIRDAGIYDAG